MDVRRNFVLAAALVIWAGGLGKARAQTAPAPQQNQDSATATPAQSNGNDANTPATSSRPSAALTPQSKLMLVRDVDGEFAKAIQPIPGGKKGYTVGVGNPIDQQSLRDALRLWGTVAGPGDTVQITGLEFHMKEIYVQINGGPKAHFHLRDHLQVGMGSGIGMTTPDSSQRPAQKLGATLILAYKKPLPEMTPEQLKQALSVMLDFSKEHSASVNWVDSLPPAFQQAIKDHRAVEGMDHEMVLAALGRPDQKVREKDDSGRETEDWIYGEPPSRTTFVTFAGEKVIRVEQFD
jgi:hypothetical protein